MIDKIRSHFPALKRTHEGSPVAYFDGPGGTQVPQSVVDAMSDYLLNHNANDGWAYPSSLETDQSVKAARRAMADFLNGEPGEIVFGQNMTSLTFHLSRAIGRQLTAGDEVIVTELDHHANVDPWKQMARDRGVTVRVACMNTDTGRLDVAQIESLISSKTKLIAIGASSNALGTVNDVPRIAALARSAGALSFVDAVHYAPHLLVDVKQFGCDFLACSAYKFYGPHTGVLWGRAELLESVDVAKLEPAPSVAPGRLETGTQSFESLCGVTAAVDLLASFGQGESRRAKLASAFAKMHEHSDRLFARLWEGLKANQRVHVFGPQPGPDRAPTVSFTIDGYSSADVSRLLASKALFLSHGNFYALTVARRYGKESGGFVRAGLACYSTMEEVDRLIAALPR